MTAPLGDADAVTAWVAHWRATGQVLPDGIARTVAAWWHSSADPGMSGLSHTGTIDPEALAGEIERDNAGEHTTDTDREELAALAAYVAEYGRRGPVHGWGGVWADKVPAPPVDGCGVTAAEFLAQLFEYERCEECGGDADAHRVGPDPLGLWHAWCQPTEDKREAERVDG